ncbi:MAG: peptide-methionine (S)-S-oxide reductase MsrA [Candidatus Methanoperedens sp.]|nr:peptide-methionine (S)-S-oxide reductase MsrA [Candidatus Methanoperedens sp.]
MLQRREIATLAGGCFWCLESIFGELRGVEKVVSGYSGGFVPDPSYQEVSRGKTCHAETVQITFDPEIISFKELLDVFFTVHDPTTLNRQGADVGTQYRSAIFFHTPQQEAAAKEMKNEIESGKIWNAPIVTEITQFKVFYPAEEYHQGYFLHNPDQQYCQIVIEPKVTKFRRQFLEKLRK